MKTVNRVSDKNAIRKLIKALSISSLDKATMIQETHSLFDSYEVDCLANNSLDYPKFKEYDNSSNLFRNSLLYRLKYDLPLDMLIKVDRMSMSNSLEVRCPFLDADLFEASTHLPDRFLRKKGLGKIVLRRMMDKKLPSAVFNHPKSGFSIPLHHFRNDDFNKLAVNLINQPYMIELFQKNTLNKILNIGITSSKDDSFGSV